VDGSVVVNSASSISHQGIRLTAVGTIMLQVRNPPQLSSLSLSNFLDSFTESRHIFHVTQVSELVGDIGIKQSCSGAHIS
jgi:hypothetical protein